MVGTLNCFVNSLFLLFRSVKKIGISAVTMLGTGKNSFIMRIRVPRVVLFYCWNRKLVEEWVLGYGIASVGPDVWKEQCVSYRPQPRHRQKAWDSPSAVSVCIGRHSVYVTDSASADFIRQIPDTVVSVLPVVTGNCTSSSFLGSV